MSWNDIKKSLGFMRRKKDMPDGLWIKCKSCEEMVYKKELEKSLYCCPKCDAHFPIDSTQRIDMLLDEGTWKEMDANLISKDPLEFEAKGVKYPDKIKTLMNSTGLNDAVLTGHGAINGTDVVFGVMDWRFIMASMGSVVGEKITRAIETATREKKPFILVCASGGARMQEGIISLMQMAKTSAALARLDDAGGLFIPVLTDPTTAGVAASFASLGDVIVAEPKALIGFAGPRVIQTTIGSELPEGFQTSEFLLEHGFVDVIVERAELKDKLSNLLSYLRPANNEKSA